MPSQASPERLVFAPPNGRLLATVGRFYGINTLGPQAERKKALAAPEGASAECGPVSLEYLMLYSARQLRTVSAQVPPAVVLAKAATAPDGERRYDLYGATKSKRMRARLALGLTQPSTGRKTDR